MSEPMNDAPAKPDKMKRFHRHTVDAMLMGYALAKPEFMKKLLEPTELLAESHQEAMWGIYEKNREVFAAFLELRLGVAVDESLPMIDSLIEHAKKYNRDAKAREALAAALSTVNHTTTANQVMAIIESLQESLSSED